MQLGGLSHCEMRLAETAGGAIGWDESHVPQNVQKYLLGHSPEQPNRLDLERLCPDQHSTVRINLGCDPICSI